MSEENTPQRAGFSSMQEAVEALQNSRKPQEQSEPETATEEPEAEPEELTDEIQAEVEQDDSDTDPDENSTEEADEDADPDEDEEEALYEVEGETFTLSELREWKKGGLRQGDYTKKTQALSAEREQFVSEREAFSQQRDQFLNQFQQERAQLQDALATFAIEQPKPPKRSDYASADDYLKAQEVFMEATQRKQQAQQTYQAMQAEQQQQIRQREANKAMQYFPEWATNEGFSSGVNRMAAVAQDFGFSKDEIINGGLHDHRTFRVLSKLADMMEQADEKNARRKAAAKKVVQASKRLTPNAPKNEAAADVEKRKARQRLKKTGSMQDAMALMRARRKG